MTPIAHADDFDAFLTRVAQEDAAAVSEVVAAVRRDDRTPALAISALDGWFLRGQTVDAGVRAASDAVPLLGGTTAADEPVASLRRTMVYVLALARLHGIDLDDPERRTALVTAVLLGDEGARLASEGLAGEGGRWARRLGVTRLARGNPLVGVLVTKIVDGGVAVALASGTEAVRARAVVAQARTAFGTPPDRFPGQRPRRPSELPPSATSAYARALARTVHRQKKRWRGSGS